MANVLTAGKPATKAAVPIRPPDRRPLVVASHRGTDSRSVPPPAGLVVGISKELEAVEPVASNPVCETAVSADRRRRTGFDEWIVVQLKSAPQLSEEQWTRITGVIRAKQPRSAPQRTGRLSPPRA